MISDVTEIHCFIRFNESMLNYKTSPTEIFSTKNTQNPYTLQDMSVCKQVYVHTDISSWATRCSTSVLCPTIHRPVPYSSSGQEVYLRHSMRQFCGSCDLNKLNSVKIMLKEHLIQNFIPMKVKELLYQHRNAKKDLMKCDKFCAGIIVPTACAQNV